MLTNMEVLLRFARHRFSQGGAESIAHRYRYGVGALTFRAPSYPFSQGGGQRCCASPLNRRDKPVCKTAVGSRKWKIKRLFCFKSAAPKTVSVLFTAKVVHNGIKLTLSANPNGIALWIYMMICVITSVTEIPYVQHPLHKHCLM